MTIHFKIPEYVSSNNHDTGSTHQIKYFLIFSPELPSNCSGLSNNVFHNYPNSLQTRVVLTNQ